MAYRHRLGVGCLSSLSQDGVRIGRMTHLGFRYTGLCSNRRFKFGIGKPSYQHVQAVNVANSGLKQLSLSIMSKFKRQPKNYNRAAAKRQSDREDSDEEDENESGEMRQLNLFFFVGTSSLAALGLISWLVSLEWSTEIYFSQFVTDLWQNEIVGKLEVVNDNIVRIFLGDDAKSRYHFKVPNVEYFENKLYQENMLNSDKYPKVKIDYVRETDWFNLFVTMVPPLLIVFFLCYFVYRSSKTGTALLKNSRGMNMFGKKNLFRQVKTDVTFKDVAGCDEAKLEIQEFVKFLTKPALYEELGAKLPKGALLTGPPGTGKTMLAKATAGEAQVPFFSISGSEFSEMFVGVGSARVRSLFASAKKSAPSIVFIDEIDAIGRKRELNSRNEERDNTLNQLLVEMDGFSSEEGKPVVVLAGTNRPDVLDAALLRPGRFDRKIELELPDIRARRQILAVYLVKLNLQNEPEEYCNKLAAMTAGFSGADLANLCNEAALIAARNDSDSVKNEHFILAIDRVVAGIENKSLLLESRERMTVAYHEAGHALVSWFLSGGDPLLKVTIIPRGKGLGYAMYIPEEHHYYTKDVIEDKITVALGGRAAEELKFNILTTGARDDLEKVTQMAYGQVLGYGMSERIGSTSFGTIRNEGYINKNYSQKTASIIDQEVRDMIQRLYDRSKSFISSNNDKFELLATTLYEKEVLDYSDCERILGKRPFGLSETQSEFLESIPHTTQPNVPTPSTS